MFSSNDISLVLDRERAPQVRNDQQKGMIAFPRPLPGWDGKLIGQLIVRNESSVVEQLNRSSDRLLIWLCLFAVVLLLLISSSLVRWVSQPLRLIMASLKRNDPKPIEGIARDRSEFGELARTTRKFFEQRDNLIREMEESGA